MTRDDSPRLELNESVRCPGTPSPARRLPVSA
jgi:hypothetical protein